MRSVRWLALSTLLILSACGGWGGYKHKSDRYGYQVTFPTKWEVWDRSDDSRDRLVATLDDVLGAQIIVAATRVAPDINPNEIYPSFLEGSGDAGRLPEFKILEKGTVTCKNGEGRMIKVRYLGDTATMRQMRAVFLGDRLLLDITIEVPQDAYLEREEGFYRMFEHVKL